MSYFSPLRSFGGPASQAPHSLCAGSFGKAEEAAGNKSYIIAPSKKKPLELELPDIISVILPLKR
jgi:hypothetical protein